MKEKKESCWTYQFQVSVNDMLGVQVMHTTHQLSKESTRIPFPQITVGQNMIKELASCKNSIVLNWKRGKKKGKKRDSIFISIWLFFIALFPISFGQRKRVISCTFKTCLLPVLYQLGSLIPDAYSMTMPMYRSVSITSNRAMILGCRIVYEAQVRKKSKTTFIFIMSDVLRGCERRYIRLLCTSCNKRRPLAFLLFGVAYPQHWDLSSNLVNTRSVIDGLPPN